VNHPALDETRLQPIPNRKRLYLFVGLLVVAAVAALCAARYSRFPGDLMFSNLLQSCRSDALLWLAIWLSWLMDSWRAALLVLLAAAIAWWRLGRREGMMVLLCGVCNVLNPLLKLAVGRPRPPPDLVSVLAVETGNAFPSGHSLFVMLLLGFLVYLCATRLNRRLPRFLWTAGLSLVILLVGISRVYLGVHWPSDVLGGYLVGGVCLAGVVWLYETWGKPTGKRRLLASRD
jgi:undecaprenyl-diphosphatase